MPPPLFTPAAILLAGGQSRRMGRDKVHLPYQGVPMAARVYGLLAEVFPTVLVVGRIEGFPVPGARCIADRRPGLGPLEGLVSGLEALDAPRALLVACDMPDLQLPLLRAMAAHAEDADALVPHSARGPEPLLAVYSRRVLPGLRAFLEAGERSARRFLETIPTTPLPLEVVRHHDPEGLSFRNLNRPDDLEAALRAPLRPEDDRPPA